MFIQGERKVENNGDMYFAKKDNRVKQSAIPVEGFYSNI